MTSSTGGASAKEQQYTFVREDGVPLNALEAEPAGAFWDGGQVTSTLDASVGTKRQTMPDKDRFMAAVVPVFTGDGQTADPITANEGATYTHEGSRNFRTHNVVGHTVASVPLLEVGKRASVSSMDPRAWLGVGEEGDPMYTLQAAAQHGVAQVIGFTAKDHGQDAADDLAPTLRSGVHAGSHANGASCQPWRSRRSHFTRGKDGAPSDVFPPLSADADKGDQDPVVLTPARTVMRVRRLMPSECELLQGFPKGHTLVPYRGKLMADGPRYKMLGNSWCVFNARWIGKRMDLLERLCPTTSN